MTDTPEQGKSTLTLRPTLQLKKTVDGGQIRQHLAHGRSKPVEVQVKKTRTFSSAENGSMVEVKTPAPQVATEDPKAPVDKAPQSNSRMLTADEKTARMRALHQAAENAAADEIIREADRKAAEERAELKAQEDALLAAQQPIEDEQPVEPAASDTEPASSEPAPAPLPQAVSLPLSSQVSITLSDDEDNAKKAHSKPKIIPGRLALPEDSDRNKRNTKSEVKTPKSRWEDHRRKLTTTNALDTEEERVRSLASLKRLRQKRRHEAPKEVEKFSREITLPETITVQELANRMAERGTDVVREIMKLGMMATVNQEIDADTAELVIQTFGHKVKRVTDADIENILITENDKEDSLIFRAPVVTIMGHVDHGKTSLLDAIRSTDVVASEAGGITQHIGAYRIKVDDTHFVTFLDTPGHEAFTAMRSRGAKVTDIVILVVAADDGIMAQTVEAINHAKAAEVPIIVAINKIDKPGADPERVRTELLSNGLVPEELGGDTIVVEVSAKKKLNLDKLLETILLQAEVLDLRANPNRAADGTVVESKVDRGRGVVTTMLVQRGTLKVGDIIVAGTASGKVRALYDDKGNVIDKAYPSMPVEVLGLADAPDAGDQFSVVENDRQAREIAEFREKRSRNIRTAVINRGSLDDLFAKASGSGKLKELPVIIKADVHGSVEAIIGSLGKLLHSEVKLRILHAAVGGITESDVALAQASNALILGFNVRANNQARSLADKEAVDVRYYSIIYALVDDIKGALSGMLSPIIREHYLGTAEIRQIFSTSKTGKVAGCYVTDGMIKRGAHVRLLRDNVVIHEGTLKTLRRFKEDVKEVKDNYECGMAFENYEDIREKDLIEAFELVEEKQVLA
jgi:translation initiation factor IF-2